MRNLHHVQACEKVNVKVEAVRMNSRSYYEWAVGPTGGTIRWSHDGHNRGGTEQYERGRKWWSMAVQSV